MFRVIQVGEKGKEFLDLMTVIAISSLFIQASRPQRLTHVCRLWNIFDFCSLKTLFSTKVGQPKCAIIEYVHILSLEQPQ